MDRGAWWAIVCWVVKRGLQLSDWPARRHSTLCTSLVAQMVKNLPAGLWNKRIHHHFWMKESMNELIDVPKVTDRQKEQSHNLNHGLSSLKPCTLIYIVFLFLFLFFFYQVTVLLSCVNLLIIF